MMNEQGRGLWIGVARLVGTVAFALLTSAGHCSVEVLTELLAHTYIHKS